MVSPKSNASKFTSSTPASIRIGHSVLPQQCTPAIAAGRLDGSTTSPSLATTSSRETLT